MNFNIIWAPWRIKYIKSVSKESKQTCLFCELPKRSDDESLILFRGKHSYIVLNAFPYTTGHLMIVPYRHTATFENLDDKILLEMFKFIKVSITVLRKIYSPDGFNIGINIGRAAGAGVESHLHIHVVPRWVGDANFMTIVGDVRVLPESLRDSYNKLKNEISKLLHDD